IECRASAPLHMWGQLDFQARKTDGDSEAGAMKAKRLTGVIGLDASVGGSAIVGGSIGFVNNHTHDKRWGDDIDADGYQIGLYGVYDPGAFYVKAMGTYNWYDGDSRRDIDFGVFGGSFAGTTRGDPDVKMWTLGLHGGYRWAISANSVLTPYLNLDYVAVTMDEFIETGLDGANLHLANNNDFDKAYGTIGAKWATQLGGVVPEVNIGYRHRFGNSNRAHVTEAFMCQTDTCPF
ncbi:autotransporter outer membrane beta-barrel domain-containing protein, partial [Sphingomonas hankyongi]